MPYKVSGEKHKILSIKEYEDMKYLIINADDFGYSKIFNEEILKLLKEWKISSTTLMVNKINNTQQAQIDKLKEFLGNRDISIWLHLEIPTENYDKNINEQYKTFIKIMWTSPSHIDIHKHPDENFILSVIKFCKDKDIPYRNMGLKIEWWRTTSRKYFSGTSNDIDNIKQWLLWLEEDGIYEILFHPGKFDKDIKSSLNKDREQDIIKIEKLTSFIKNLDIKITSFYKLK